METCLYNVLHHSWNIKSLCILNVIHSKEILVYGITEMADICLDITRWIRKFLEYRILIYKWMTMSDIQVNVSRFIKFLSCSPDFLMQTKYKQDMNDLIEVNRYQMWKYFDENVNSSICVDNNIGMSTSITHLFTFQDWCFLVAFKDWNEWLVASDCSNGTGWDI